MIERSDEIWSGGESVASGIKTDRQTLYEVMIVHETELAVLQVAAAGELQGDVREKPVFGLLIDLRT